jgi:hypothetical protein
LIQYLSVDTLREFWKLIRELKNNEVDDMQV